MKNGGDPFSTNPLKGKVANTLPNTAGAGSGDLILDTNRTSQEERGIITERESIQPSANVRSPSKNPDRSISNPKQQYSQNKNAQSVVNLRLNFPSNLNTAKTENRVDNQYVTKYQGIVEKMKT